MTVLRRGLLSLVLMILPGSCIAAPGTAPLAMAPRAATLPNPPEIGRFRLDRRPEQGSISRGIAPQGTRRLVINGADVAVAPDLRFIVGFGRDHGETTLITAFLRSGEPISETLPVAKRMWRTEHLARLPHHSQPDAEFQDRRPGELAEINAARRKNHDADGWRESLIWPATGRISGLFGSQRIYAGEPGAPHSGVDVAGAIGTLVVAPASGVVTLAANRPFTLEGNLLMIDHGMGLNSAFLHLSRIDVRSGDRVVQGQVIGAIGQTGRATGPHLHWGMKWHDERIDPQPLAGVMIR